ncbi:hypothetical protein CgunFtcFv8_009686 [Champsocephalus gunnari]|uniref:Uncharacterized protein n=1 Tax=Champsocephalus gunnari TaxID=52237 RepID=A0AAN8C4Y0_CHAGU|nr:hypothetical protein CgunFtcFv8_009686 [Champsocephalus gunnari]
MGLGGESSKKHGDAREAWEPTRLILCGDSRCLHRSDKKKTLPHGEQFITSMEEYPAFTDHGSSEAFWADSPHRFQICPPPFLPQSSGPQRSIVSPSAKGRIQKNP